VALKSGKGAAQHDRQLFDALTITRYSGWEFFAFKEVGRQELVGPTTKRLSVVREPLTPLFPRTVTRTTDKRLLN
jgi:hypothetical protein